MVVSTEEDKSDLSLAFADGEASVLDHPELERIRLGNPAARALPLLQAIAIGEQARVCIPYLGRQLRIEVNPT
jgi:hypothetical protein